MELVQTVGQRLAFYGDIIYGSTRIYAEALRYKKPNSLYEYFNGKKLLGRAVLERFESLGGNPEWVLSGNGPIFSSNKIGQELQARFIDFLRLPVVQQPSGLYLLYL